MALCVPQSVKLVKGKVKVEAAGKAERQSPLRQKLVVARLVVVALVPVAVEKV